MLVQRSPVLCYCVMTGGRPPYQNTPVSALSLWLDSIKPANAARRLNTIRNWFSYFAKEIHVWTFTVKPLKKCQYEELTLIDFHFAREFSLSLEKVVKIHFAKNTQSCAKKKKLFCLHMIGWWKISRASPHFLSSGATTLAKCTGYLPLVNQPHRRQ